MPINRDEFLSKLRSIVSTDQRKKYGPPERNFERIAVLWNAYLEMAVEARPVGNSIDPHDVAIMMILMKVARLVETPGHADSWMDVAGYAVCGAEIAVPEPDAEEWGIGQQEEGETTNGGV